MLVDLFLRVYRIWSGGNDPRGLNGAVVSSSLSLHVDVFKKRKELGFSNHNDEDIAVIVRVRLVTRGPGPSCDESPATETGSPLSVEEIVGTLCLPGPPAALDRAVRLNAPEEQAIRHV